MIKKILLLTLVLSCIAGYGQITKKRADKYMDDLAFTKAISLYEAHLEDHKNDAEAKLNLARCYIKVNEPAKAAEWYSSVIDSSIATSTDVLNYAQMLAEIKNYQLSKKYFAKYNEMEEGHKFANKKSVGFDNIDLYYKDSSLVKVTEFDYNSPEIDFAPAFYKDGIIFSSSRDDGTEIVKNNFSWNMKSFLDLYTFEEGDTMIHKFDDKVNSKFHEGAVAFNDDNSHIFFTRNNYLNGKKGKNTKGVNLIKLYEADLQDGDWENIREFTYDSDEYSTGDPFFYAPEKTLFFVSDNPDGNGGLDIYKSMLIGDTAWSPPVNLGPEINTPANERSPFIDDEGVLYFSSTGHPGLGGLDVYEVDYDFKTGEVKSSIENLGYPINSSVDDFGFIYKTDYKRGYFASNRHGGTGGDDIYYFVRKEVPGVPIEGVLFVQTQGQEKKDKLSNAKVEIWDETNNEIVDKFTPDKNAEFSTKLKPGSRYKITATSDSLVKDEFVIDLTATKEFDKKAELILIKVPPKPTSVILNGAIVESNSSDPLEGVSLYLLNQANNKTEFLKTDDQGRYLTYLDPNTDYVLKGEKPGYISKCVSFKSGEASKAEYELNESLMLEKIELNRVFEIENVYFDVSKWNIRPDAAVELDKVVRFLNENESILVELGSHTDSRGSDAYNQSLSAKRAKSSVEYIVQGGISADRITYKGYGETEVLNRCKNGVKCSDKEHQVNRRTEIKITGIKEVDENAKPEKSNGLTAEDDYSHCDKTILVKKKEG